MLFTAPKRFGAHARHLESKSMVGSQFNDLNNELYQPGLAVSQFAN
jgi:hypothetical protein